MELQKHCLSLKVCLPPFSFFLLSFIFPPCVFSFIFFYFLLLLLKYSSFLIIISGVSVAITNITSSACRTILQITYGTAVLSNVNTVITNSPSNLVNATNAYVTITNSHFDVFDQLTFKNSSLNMEDSTIGGINYGINAQSSNVTMKRMGVYVIGGPFVKMTGGRLEMNSVNVTGSGLANVSVVQAMSLECVLVNSSFSSNTSTPSKQLSGMDFRSCAVRMEGVTITSMSSTMGAGGLYFGSSNVDLRGCTISSNRGADGGGMTAMDSNVTVENSTFDNNICTPRAACSGGGCFIVGTASFTNTVFSNNIGGIGGGVAASGTSCIHRSPFNIFLSPYLYSMIPNRFYELHI